MPVRQKDKDRQFVFTFNLYCLADWATGGPVFWYTGVPVQIIKSQISPLFFTFYCDLIDIKDNGLQRFLVI